MGQKICLVFILLTGVAFAFDSEWPPEVDVSSPENAPDPKWDMGVFDVAFPANSDEVHSWIMHQHSHAWGSYATEIRYGDVDGEDDGDLCAVFYVEDEVIFAVRLDLDWSTSPPTGTMTPLFAMMLPAAKNPYCGLGGTCPGDHGPYPNGQPSRAASNLLIWDVNEDGRNEVVFCGYNETGTGVGSNLKAAVWAVQQDDNPPPSGWDFPNLAPPPVVLGVADVEVPAGAYEAAGPNRVGLCRVRDTDGRRDIVVHCHKGDFTSIYHLASNPPAMIRDYHAHYWSSSQTINRDKAQIMHEWNYEDVDGDGYDEFMWDGVLDFVDDNGGQVQQINGTWGKFKWVTGIRPTGLHIDQMIVCDYEQDPANPRLLINGATENPWTDPNSVSRLGVDTMWDIYGDANGYGVIVRENTNAFCTHPQCINVGNWTKTRQGYESLYIPKFNSSPPSDARFSGAYVTDALQEDLSHDGYAWFTNSAPPYRRCGGPAGAEHPEQIDWDGDYSQDEVITTWSNQALYVWRMGEKGDWLPGPMPSYMPQSEAEVLAGWDEQSMHLNWWYYTGGAGWAWNNGAAGRGTHYWEKLAETVPWWLKSTQAYDMGGDYREEIVCNAWKKLKIYYNKKPLATPGLHRSPVKTTHYRRMRLEHPWCHGPIQYQNLPTLQRIEVVADDPANPKYVLGMTTGVAEKAFKAIGHYSDGATEDLTAIVDWETDVPGFIEVFDGDVFGGWVTPLVPEISARITAKLVHPTKTFVSNAAYVYSMSSSNNKPAILMAGLKETYLAAGEPWETMQIEAYVAQRENKPCLGALLNSDNPADFWMPGGAGVMLFDDGNGFDETANDGIYTGSIYAPEYYLGAGDFIKYLLVADAVDPYNPLKQSDRWPLYRVGTGGTLVQPYVFPNNVNESKMAHVKVCGNRGIKDSTFVFLEAEVVPASDPNVGFAGLYAHIENGSGTQFALMDFVGEFDGRYIFQKWIDTSQSPFTPYGNGDYIIGCQAWSYDISIADYVLGDPWPYIRIH